MGKNLIDRNKAFDIYYSLGTSRSLHILYDALSQKYPKHAPSYDTLRSWSKKEAWQERILILDKDVNDSVHQKMAPEWAEVKSYFLKTLIEQVKLGREAGVIPKSTSDLTVAIKEARSIMGEGEKHDVTISGIEYIPAKQVNKNEDKED